MRTKLLIISVLLFSLTGWAHGSGSQKKVHVQREFDLKVGREVLVKEAGISLKFDRIVDDSRCPQGVDCIWAGNGKITVMAQKGTTKSITFELNTMTEQKSYTYRGYEITLVKLSPYPKKDVTIKQGEYVATLMVRKK